MITQENTCWGFWLLDLKLEQD